MALSEERSGARHRLGEDTTGTDDNADGTRDHGPFGTDGHEGLVTGGSTGRGGATTVTSAYALMIAVGARQIPSRLSCRRIPWKTRNAKITGPEGER